MASLAVRFVIRIFEAEERCQAAVIHADEAAADEFASVIVEKLHLDVWGSRLQALSVRS